MTDTPKIVPQEKYVWLNSTTANLFMRDRHLRPFVVKTCLAGIGRLGAFVQRSENEVFTLAPTSDNNKRKVSETIKELGLEFGMQAPGWVNPDVLRRGEER